MHGVLLGAGRSMKAPRPEPYSNEEDAGAEPALGSERERERESSSGSSPKASPLWTWAIVVTRLAANRGRCDSELRS